MIFSIVQLAQTFCVDIICCNLSSNRTARNIEGSESVMDNFEGVSYDIVLFAECSKRSKDRIVNIFRKNYFFKWIFTFDLL